MRIPLAHFFVHYSYGAAHPATSTRQAMSEKHGAPVGLMLLHAPSLVLQTTAIGPNRSIFKALFPLVLNHTVDDELEDGHSFVTDVGGCIATSRRMVAFILDTLRLCY